MGFKVPVVLFMFKRIDTLLQIVERLSIVKPEKVYLLSDGPRNEEEKSQILNCHMVIEKSISWDCEIITHYTSQNIGVYSNIGEGARWVFSKEEIAIFLEDDNLPELTFFDYCKEMLERYKHSEQVLWVCGTNYLEKYDGKNSYVFTQHLLPCGWASWSHKFLKYYDGELDTLYDNGKRETFRKTYDNAFFRNHSLYKQQLFSAERTKYLLTIDKKKASWDFQLIYSLRANNMYGISPCCNQIKNIGVDNLSTHGGNSFKYVMTRRFCGMKSLPLELPLTHPETIEIDPKYEKLVGNIILVPFILRIKKIFARGVKFIFGINKYDSLKSILRSFTQN